MALGYNYATKYSNVVDERFRTGALTSGISNNDYDWIGVKTVMVYTVPTVAMNNYQMEGTSRYGSPAELQNNTQELSITQDRSFTFTIDLKQQQDTLDVMAAAKALRRQIDEVVIPEIDKYRIAKLVAGAPVANVIEATSSAANAYTNFLAMQEKLDDASVPGTGRFCICTPSFYNFLKLDDNFIKKGDMAQQVAFTGVIGECDGVYFIKAPTSYFPTGVDAILTNNQAMVSPVKLFDYYIWDRVPGVSGNLIEGRFRYDAFILNNKANAIAVIQAA